MFYCISLREFCVEVQDYLCLYIFLNYMWYTPKHTSTDFNVFITFNCFNYNYLNVMSIFDFQLHRYIDRHFIPIQSTRTRKLVVHVFFVYPLLSEYVFRH